MDLLVTARLLPLSDADGPTGLTEVGWHLHPGYQGRGFATEAAAALLQADFPVTDSGRRRQ